MPHIDNFSEVRPYCVMCSKPLPPDRPQQAITCSNECTGPEELETRQTGRERVPLLQTASFPNGAQPLPALAQMGREEPPARLRTFTVGDCRPGVS